MVAPIDDSIKKRIVAAHLSGLCRNQIDRQLKEQKVKVSHGSISDIITKYKHQQGQSVQPRTEVNTASLRRHTNINDSLDQPSRVATFTLAEAEFKNNKDISIKDHLITNTHGYPVAPAKSLGVPIPQYLVLCGHIPFAII